MIVGGEVQVEVIVSPDLSAERHERILVDLATAFAILDAQELAHSQTNQTSRETLYLKRDENKREQTVLAYRTNIVACVVSDD